MRYYEGLGRLKRGLFLFLFFHMSICAIMFLTGCSGSENIPPASILKSGRVMLAWKDVPSATTYNVYISTSPGVTVLNSYKISDVKNPITIADLEPNTTYYFVITVEDDSGQSWKSKEMSYKAVAKEKGYIQFNDILSDSETYAAASDSHIAPDELFSNATLEASVVTLAWDDVPGATSYNIYLSNISGVTIKNGFKISNVKSPHKISGLKKGQKYYIVVTAINASGESNVSEEISFIVGQ